MKRFILSALFFIALLSIWHLLVLAKVWSPVLLPDPISVWEYLKGAAEDGTLVQASLVTMRRLFAGYIIGIAAGLPLGLLTARYKFCEDTIGVLALGLQTLPRAPRSSSSTKPRKRIPALFTRISRRPKRSTVCVTAAFTAAGSVLSAL